MAIRERKHLFAQAPTGIGKTMAALYPALMAIREGHCARALFLTARTTGRRSAVDALLLLARSGIFVMATELVAKDKACPQPVRDCRAESCPYARGFYDRIGDALCEAAADGGVYDRARIGELAEKHCLCPFELSLEMAKISDVVIGDYNYVYDPFVAIDALLQGHGGACLLVDEAHQLSSRVRDALSGAADMDALRTLRRECGKRHGRKSQLYKALTGAISALKEIASQPEFAAGQLEAVPRALAAAMKDVLEAAGGTLAAEGSPEAVEAFHTAAAFTLAAERFDLRYAALATGGEKHAVLRLQCLDASPEILAASKRARGTAYFSATMAPFAAAQRMLGSEEGDACLALPSPFDPAQLCARVEPVDIRYAAREETAPQVARAIVEHLQEHAGHTLVFFPSYAYMERILELVLGMDGLTDTEFLKETRGMTEEEKNALLGAFDERNTERTALFAVLGGGFSEGIDLPGERLKNVIVVSTGLPQPDAGVRALQRYYDAQGEDGFFMAMTLPGMIRVIQAAGRLIRTHGDTGSLLLIDRRFTMRQIRSLLCGTLAGSALGIYG
ncbi:MAG: ATP-dependent DNA helicase [Clostridia bacterium]|nr:ATP-dependent DNA helicase [Clostridia bacterium]